MLPRLVETVILPPGNNAALNCLSKRNAASNCHVFRTATGTASGTGSGTETSTGTGSVTGTSTETGTGSNNPNPKTSSILDEFHIQGLLTVSLSDLAFCSIFTVLALILNVILTGFTYGILLLLPVSLVVYCFRYYYKNIK